MANVPTQTVPTPIGVRSERPSHHPTPTPSRPAPARDSNIGSLDPYEFWRPTKEWAYSDAVGSSQTVDKGWDATRGKLGNARHTAAITKANAVITDGQNGFQMSVFVSNLAMDSALSGSTAQSQLVQDFYPHNFVQPSIVVTGWSLDQEDYGLLCEFIHSCQHKSITSNNARWPSFMTQLCVFGRDGMRGVKGEPIPGTQRGVDGNRAYGRKVTVEGSGENDATYFNQTIRGSHKTTVAKGFISTMPREHGHFQNAVQWQFSFTVAAMIKGLYADGNVPAPQLQQTWKDVLAEAKRVGVSTVTAAENKASLAYAASHAATLTGAPNPGGSGAGGGGGSPGGGAGPPTGLSGNYGSPFTKKMTQTTRIDDGVDFGNLSSGYSGGDPILAIGDCYLRRIDPAWAGAGKPCMFFELTDKSAGYWGWYVAEGIRPPGSPGYSSLIKGGSQVAAFINGTGSIEIGWAASDTLTAAQANHHTGDNTPEGQSFLSFLKSVGAV